MNIKAILIIVFIATSGNIFAQIGDRNFSLDLDYNIMGVYLPVEYIESLKRTKHNPMSWAQFGENYINNVYIIDEFSIKACGMYDGVAKIYVWEMLNFQFEKINGDVILVDDRNNRFKKLPGDLYEYEHWSDIICEFIGNIVLEELIKNREIILESGFVTFPALGNRTFRVRWQTYNPTDKKNLRFEEVPYVPNNDDLSLEINQDKYIFYGYQYFSEDIVWSYKRDGIP